MPPPPLEMNVGHQFQIIKRNISILSPIEDFFRGTITFIHLRSVFLTFALFRGFQLAFQHTKINYKWFKKYLKNQKLLRGV